MKKIFFFYSLFFFSYTLSNINNTPHLHEKNRQQRSAQTWDNFIEKISNAVVKIETCDLNFDWLHPYKSPDQSYGSGSGFFIDEEYIITNAHVIQNTAYAKITLPQCGKEPFTVDIIGFSPTLDIALLKLQPSEKERLLKKIKTIPSLSLGDSDTITQAQKLTVLGYPLGFDNVRCSMGIYAGPEYSHCNSYFHITASINPGNSGGPVVDKHGNVIGVVVSKRLKTESIGYAIPINNVKNILPFLLKEKIYITPRLYIRGNYGSNDLYEHFNNPTHQGMLITQISPLSLLHDKGIHAGDILYSLSYDSIEYVIDRFGNTIVPWNNKPVPFSELYYRLPLDAEIFYTIFRNGEKITGSFFINQQKKSAVRDRYPLFEKIDFEVFGGLVLMDLSLNHFPYFYSKHAVENNPWTIDEQIKETTNGYVIVTDILGGSPAFNSRAFGMGSILHSVNDIVVHSVNDVRRAIKESKNKKFITFKELYSGFCMVLSVQEICNKEEKLAKQYRFSISSLIEYLS